MRNLKKLNRNDIGSLLISIILLSAAEICLQAVNNINNRSWIDIFFSSSVILTIPSYLLTKMEILPFRRSVFFVLSFAIFVSVVNTLLENLG